MTDEIADLLADEAALGHRVALMLLASDASLRAWLAAALGRERPAY